MRGAFRCLGLALSAMLVTGVRDGFAQGGLERVKVTGTWTEGRLLATRIQDRGGKKDSRSGKVAGSITAVGGPRAFQVGPVTVTWTDSTEFVGLTAQALTRGTGVEVSGRIEGNAHLIATTIEKAAAARGEIQILAPMEDHERLADGSRTFRLLGVPVMAPKRIFALSSELTRNPDDRRPAEQLTVDFLGRPLTIGGEVGTNSDHRRGFALDSDERDRSLQLEQEVQLELTYPVGTSTLVFLEAQGGYASEREAAGEPMVFDWRLERGESWVYFEDIGRSGFGLQVGRQKFYETREWWWDKDLDGIRLRYDRPSLHAEAAFARDIAPLSFGDDAEDPEDAGIRRWFGQVGWLWRRGHRLEGFFLDQRDRSGTPPVGTLIPERDEDESDAALHWFGARLSGELEGPELEYWLQTAALRGQDRRVDFASVDGDSSEVTDRSTTSIRGWAVDAGVSLTTELPGSPTFTLTYARGSGDDDPDDGVDRSFRQTGIHDNNDKFGGVDRFRYYGELLRPELSNLEIWTAAAGIPLFRSSSIELLYHRYQQVHPAEALPDARIDADPGGERPGIGHEWDLVIGLEEWRHFEVEAIGSLFRAGPAFGERAGTTVRAWSLKVDYNF